MTPQLLVIFNKTTQNTSNMFKVNILTTTSHFQFFYTFSTYKQTIKKEVEKVEKERNEEREGKKQ